MGKEEQSVIASVEIIVTETYVRINGFYRKSVRVARSFFKNLSSVTTRIYDFGKQQANPVWPHFGFLPAAPGGTASKSGEYPPASFVGFPHPFYFRF